MSNALLVEKLLVGVNDVKFSLIESAVAVHIIVQNGNNIQKNKQTDK